MCFFLFLTRIYNRINVSLSQRGPTTGPRNNFVQAAATFFLKNAMILGRKRNFVDRFQLKTFFFFREHPEFGTKIGILEIDFS